MKYIRYRQFERWLLLLALIATSMVLAGKTPAQTPPVTREEVMAPPPAISFPDWEQVDSTEDWTEYEEHFPSAYLSGSAINDVVPLRIFIPEPANQPVPVILIAHYLGATDLRPEVALAKLLALRGIASAVITLPYHMSRTPQGTRSGELAIQPDPNKLTAVMLQSELDCRRAIDFLETRPEFLHDHIGMVGTSLGALVASLTYALDPRIQEAAFLLGGADLAHIIWESSRVVAQRDELRRKGWTESKLRTALAPVEPLSYLPRTNPGHTLLIYGEYDTVMPKADTMDLAQALQNTRLLPIDTGHYGGAFIEQKVLRTVAEFFEQESKGRTYNPPQRLVAPTLRVGALASTGLGFDLGIGIDFVHFDKAGSRFGTVFATPRGLRVLLEQKLGQGFSTGFVGSNKGVGVGLMWSTVL